MQLIECVPNISEGRDATIIAQIAQTISEVDGAFVLHKDIGHSVNRTVLTFAGEPQAVSEAAFRVIAKTNELIDMRIHKGSHPRIGATDVCPIIPLANITMAECVDLSKKLAKRVGDELSIPVYLYAESAQTPERKSLAYIRGGEYEKLFLRIDELLFKPDFGPVVCNAKSGATAIGARKILIAYNVYIDTKDLSIAKSIAQTIRERRQQYQQISLPAKTGIGQGQNEITWQDCQAIGWYIDEYKCCQISLNLLDYKKTSMHAAYLGVSSLASKYGIKVTGSELIGLCPLEALLDAGKFVLDKETKGQNIADENKILQAAIQFLKLSKFSTFKAAEKVLEYKLAEFGLSLPTSSI